MSQITYSKVNLRSIEQFPNQISWQLICKIDRQERHRKRHKTSQAFDYCRTYSHDVDDDALGLYQLCGR